MAPTEIRFTALPDGFSEKGNARIAVFISHMLPDNTVPRFLSTWPAVADALKFKADVRTAGNSGIVQGGPFSTRKIESGTTAEATATWTLIFPPPITAEGRKPAKPLVNAPFIYSVRDVGAGLLTYHTKMAGALTQGDATNVITALVSDKAFVADLQTLEQFHQPPAPIVVPSTANKTFAEFHNRVTALIQYPSVLRLVRLVVELEVIGLTSDLMPNGGSIAAFISGFTSNSPGDAADLQDPTKVTLVYPWVQYDTSPPYGVFTANFTNTGRPSGLRRFGIASLASDKDFYATVSDIDGGGLGIQRHIVKCKKARREKLTTLPNRRGRGLQIFDLNEATNLQPLTKELCDASAAASQNPTPFGNRPNSGTGVPVLDGRHVLRGYRIDVRSGPKPKPSQSLCLRLVSIPELPTGWRRNEEAAVVTGISSAPQASGVDYKSTQLLFRWTDWSLVVPSPRLVPPPASSNPIKVGVIPDTLPKLRYGLTYFFRARAVDVAGNGCTAEQASFLEPEGTWREVTYLRHDLIPPPVFAKVKDKKNPSKMTDPGKTVVLRSGQTVTDRETREIVAPASTFENMRLSGALDNLTGAGLKALDQACQGTKHFIDPATNGVVVSVGWPATSSPSSLPVKLEYKPDGSKEIQKLLVEGNKKVHLTFRRGDALSLYASSLTYSIDVRVPPGRVVEVWLRSLIPSTKLSQLELYGVPQSDYQQYGFQYSRLAAPARLTVVHATEKPTRAPAFDISDGPGPISIRRKLGKTAVYFAATDVTIDNESTGQVELQANWDELLDRVAPDGSWPTRSKASANLASVPILLPDGHPWAQSGSPSIASAVVGSSAGTGFAPGDTLAVIGGGGKGGILTVATVSSGAIDSFTITNGGAGYSTTTGAALAIISSATGAGSPTANITASAVDYKSVNLTGTHDFGDGKGRRITGYLLAVSRFAKYFPTDTNAGANPLRFALKSLPVEVAVPASVPPSSPQVVYMVPTIARSSPSKALDRWKRETEAWGLRVYLRRGWFTSGDGEALAAILRSSDPDSNGVSQIGTDPALSSVAVANDFNAGHFENGLHVRNVLRPKSKSVNSASSGGDPDDHLDIMVFPVFFDATKNLLYSDIVLRPMPVYRPFIRFALARYQANALDQAHLSPTTTVDFIQIGPQRTLSITREGDTLHVGVTGSSADQGASSLKSRVIAITEHKADRDEPWKEAERIVLSPSQSGHPSDSFWTGEITRTHDHFNRIVVEEFEVTSAFESTGSTDHLPPAVDIELYGRLVFTDSYEY
jgi:hypothetical protein